MSEHSWTPLDMVQLEVPHIFSMKSPQQSNMKFHYRYIISTLFMLLTKLGFEKKQQKKPAKRHS